MSSLNKSSFFRLTLASFLGGILLGSFYFVDFFWLYLAGLGCLIFLIVFYPHKEIRLVFVIGIFFAAGVFRYQLSLPDTADPATIWFYNNQKITFEAIVTAPPDVRVNQTKLTVAARQLAEKSVTGKVLVNTGLYPKRNYGDRLLITCQLKAPEAFNGFAYDRYLAKSYIYSQCSRPQIKFLAAEQGNVALAKIYGFKTRLESLINQGLPEPQAGLAAAIILGTRSATPDDLNEAFNITGTTHLIAISGLQITLLINLLLAAGLALGISRRRAFWLITMLLVGYVVIIGFPASAVRAAVMGYLVLLAQHVGRPSRSTNIFILAAAVMAAVNPKIVRDDIGFQLSFAAVWGLLYFGPRLEKYLLWLPKQLAIRESLQMTLAAQITTLPIVIFYFGRLSLVAPLVNILVVPFSAHIMIIGLLALAIGLCNFWLGQILLWPVWLLLAYTTTVINFFAQIPLAAINL